MSQWGEMRGYEVDSHGVGLVAPMTNGEVSEQQVRCENREFWFRHVKLENRPSVPTVGLRGDLWHFESGQDGKSPQARGSGGACKAHSLHFAFRCEESGTWALGVSKTTLLVSLDPPHRATAPEINLQMAVT